MKSQSTLTIRIGAGTVLVGALSGLGLLIFLLVSTTGAQEGSTPTTNNVGAAAETEAPPSESPDFGQPPDGYAWTINGELVSLDAANQRPENARAPSAVTATGRGRKYYLTDANWTTDEALTACAAGYHMASLWEIIDPSNLTYAFDHPDAHTKDDGGEGPPSLWNGWVRTGSYSSSANSAGFGNCAAWTSAVSGNYGTTVRLIRSWETPPNEIGGYWDASSFSCAIVGPVWCIAD